jgi:hypothetical protein
MPDDTGHLLASAGLVSEEHLRIASRARQVHGGTVPEHLVLLGLCDDEQLTTFFRQSLRISRVSASQLEAAAAAALSIVPRDLAIDLRAVPVAFDSEQNLVVALSDPSNSQAVEEIAFFTGCYVVRVVASQSDIARALAHHYSADLPMARTLAAGAAPASLEEAEVTGAAAEDDDGPDTPRAAKRRRESRNTAPNARRDSAVVEPRAGAPIEDTPEPDTREILRLRDPAQQRRSLEPPRAVAGEVKARVRRVHLSERLAPVIISDKRLVEASYSPDDESPVTFKVPVPHAVSVEAAQPAVIQPRSTSTESGAGGPAGTADAGGQEVVLLDRAKPAPAARRPGVTRQGLGAASRKPAARPTDRGYAVESAAGRPASERSHPAGSEGATLPGPSAPAASRPDVGGADRPADDRAAGAAGPTSRTIPAARDLASALEATTRPREQRSARHQAAPEAAPVAPIDDDVPTNRYQVVDAPDVEIEADAGIEAEFWGKPGTSLPTHVEAEPPVASVPIAAEPPTSRTAEEPEPEAVVLVSGPAPVSGLPPARQSPPVRPLAAPAVAPGGAFHLNRRPPLRFSDALDGIRSTQDRDDCIRAAVEYMAASHEHACFVTANKDILRPWSLSRVTSDQFAPQMTLAPGSTLYEVVATRLPYRGPADQPTSAFLAQVIGTVPKEITALPISVRGRVVGILVGDGRGASAPEHLVAELARSLGGALEAILLARKAKG